MRPVALAALGLLALACLPGCGADPTAIQHPVDVEPQRLEAQSRRSPQDTVLAWWSALQARDTDAAIGLLTPAARRLVDPVETRFVLGGDFGDWLESTDPTVLYTERDRGSAAVFMRIDVGQWIGPVHVTDASTTLALPAVRRNERWLIDNSAWLRVQTATYAAWQRAASHARQRRDGETE
jgi:hypothetical protein